MTTFLILCTLACVLTGAGLITWMFRRGDELAGLAGLTLFAVGGCFAVVYGSLTS